MADKAPVTCGVKAAYTVQEADAARVVGQVLIWLNEAGLVPVIAIEIRCTAAVPVLVMVTDLAAEIFKCVVVGNARLAVLRVIGGTGVAVPLKEACCGDPDALSVTDRVAVRAPVDAGLKAMKIPQVAEAASVVPQLVNSGNAAGLVPVRPMEVRFAAALPEFVTVIVWAALAIPVPAMVFGKVSELALSLTMGPPAATAVPVREAV